MLQALAAAKAAGAAERANEEQITGATEMEDEPVPKSKVKKAVMITILSGLVLIAAVVAAFWYMNTKMGEAAKEPVEQYMSGYAQKDVDKILNSYPGFMRDILTANTSKEKIWNSVEEGFKAAYGDDWKMEYKLGSTEEIRSDEISSLSSYLSQYYSTTLNIKKAYWVDVDMTFSGSLSSNTLKLRMASAEIDGKWYVIHEAARESEGSSESGAAETNAAQ